MTVLIASVVAGFKCDGIGDMAWLTHADQWAADGHEFFLAAQTSQGRDGSLRWVCDNVTALGGTVWRYSLDQGEQSVSSDNRLVNICTGRNLAHEYAQRRPDIEAIMFIDSDVTPPADGIRTLMQVDRPIVGGHIENYCLDGPRVSFNMSTFGRWAVRVGRSTYERSSLPFPKEFDVREHWTSAGALLVRRPVFRKLRWRWDADANHMTDDPCFQHDAVDAGFGMTWTVHSSLWDHPILTALENRGHDLEVRRDA